MSGARRLVVRGVFWGSFRYPPFRSTHLGSSFIGCLIFRSRRLILVRPRVDGLVRIALLEQQGGGGG